VTEWWAREIAGTDHAVPLAGHGVTNDRTDLVKIGLAFLRRVMLMDTKLAR
jgi:hypothetical protein